MRACGLEAGSDGITCTVTVLLLCEPNRAAARRVQASVSLVGCRERAVRRRPPYAPLGAFTKVTMFMHALARRTRALTTTIGGVVYKVGSSAVSRAGEWRAHQASPPRPEQALCLWPQWAAAWPLVPHSRTLERRTLGSVRPFCAECDALLSDIFTQRRTSLRRCCNV